jgi:hypothetical protein
MNTFTSVDDRVLQDVIGAARHRLVFIAPGLRPPVAEALAKAMAILPPDSVHLVFDVDAEVCRLGYGDKDFKGMELLQAAAAHHDLTVNHQQGIRIGLVIADDTTLIYSPTPELIAPQNGNPNKPNAICLKTELPAQLARACAMGPEKHATLEVGKDPVRRTAIEIVKKELAERPPKAFNIARVERVFNSMLHYVEFRIEDYKLTSRSVSLNPKLFGVKNADVVRRLTNRYHLFAETDALTVEIPAFDEDAKPLPEQPIQKFGPRSIDDERNRIKKRFILEAGDRGLIILRKDVVEFKKQLKVLEAQIAAYKEAVHDAITNRTNAIVTELLAALKDSLRKDPPADWTSRFLGKEPTNEDIERLFREEIAAEVKRVSTDFNPHVFHDFKDVTYDTFHDKGFRALLEHRFGKNAIDRIFTEHDAAPETASKTDADKQT